MANICVVVVAIFVLGMLFVFIKRTNKKSQPIIKQDIKEEAEKATASPTGGKTPHHPSSINTGSWDGEYLICPNCKHKNRVGIGFDHPRLPCAGCGKIIVIRRNDKEMRIGELLDAQFDSFDTLGGR